MPSALDMLDTFKEAVEHARVSKRGLPLREALAACIAAYNKGVARKLDTKKKSLLLNLMRAPEEFIQHVDKHYDRHKQSQSGCQRCCELLCFRQCMLTCLLVRVSVCCCCC